MDIPSQPTTGKAEPYTGSATSIAECSDPLNTHNLLLAYI